MSEFSIIDKYCTNIGVQHSATLLGLGDDAAIVSIPAQMSLAISVDTMVEGVHFYPNTHPESLAHKLMAVNLSDMAAMGALPQWATLSLTLPTNNAQWLHDFTHGLNTIAQAHQVELIGGDTTQGNLSLSIQIMGLLPKGKALTRNNAQLGDDVYVSNTIGDAALALANQAVMQPNDSLRLALERPQPQVALGRGLLNIANACIDISDGLVADLSHIARLSKVSLELELERLPISTHYQHYLQNGGTLDLALSGGDDYQLAFTLNPADQAQLHRLADELGVKVTKIGTVIEASNEAVILRHKQQAYQLGKADGYQHFANSY